MKKFSLLVVAVILTLATSCSQSKYETVKNDPLGTQMYTLDNGLKVFMSVNKETPRIQTYIAVKVGGKNDPSETTGLAHYFEHLMFKGTKQFGTSDYAAEEPMLNAIEVLFEQYRQTSDEQERAAIYHQIDSISYEASKIAIPNEYDKLMAMIGANGTNAWTSHDETVYTEDIPSNQIDNWARIQADRFRNTVVRGFHTELETIYEEKNMSLTQDSRKVWEAVDNALFPHHPYGKQTVLGTQDHLKNPSITNVKKYHDTYYVPNNIAICVSGDFDPDEMVGAIEKYFGDWEPNPDIPVLEFEKEAPIEAPIVREVFGLEPENLAIAWPLPGASNLKETATAEIASAILFNGQAGLIDLDIYQQQKALSAGCGTSIQPDYSEFLLLGHPKEGQSLEDLQTLLLDEVAKLRNGEFNESIIEATINNIRLSKMQQLENNSSRAVAYVNAFINGIDWADAADEISLYSTITKDDVVEWANTYLGAQNYAVVFKRMGEAQNVKKIAAPAITPIVTNRDNQSQFLNDIQNNPVNPIDPSFIDFNWDIQKRTVAQGVELLYKHNSINKVFHLSYIFNVGFEDNPNLTKADDYIQYLGTETMSAEQIASRMYELACSFNIGCGARTSSVNISGLAENMPEAMRIVEDLIYNAKADENILSNLKADIIKERADSKLKQRSCFSALNRYMMYGPEYIKSITPSNDQILALSSEDMLNAVRGLCSIGHEVLYYGPENEFNVTEAIKNNHKIEEGLVIPEEKFAKKLTTPENTVILAQYDAKQIYYMQYSNRGEKLDVESEPALTLYNEYFGGGMNTVVFQEMREARGLAYSAWADLASPTNIDDDYCFEAFIATQNDKMKTAIEAFDEIINNMPESDAAFSVAKDALISRLRTERCTGINFLYKYRNCRRLGLEQPLDKAIFDKAQNMTLEDITAAQQKWVKGRTYTYGILGDIKDLDIEYLNTLGPVKTVSLEEIFGF